MKLLQSASGITKTEERWRKENDDMWHELIVMSEGTFQKPKDAFERFARVAGLREVTAEEAGWNGIF